MKQIEKVGLLLTSGLTKKEIASRLKKSTHTINQQTRILYEKTGSRNLADITRHTIGSILHLDIDGILSSMISQAIIVVIALLIIELVCPDLSHAVSNLLRSVFANLKPIIP